MYIAVGNPIPYSGVIRGPGKELFTDSIIALSLKTGKLRWYFQTTHHDLWDYDATNPTVLYDLNGKKVIAQAGKTGWVYILNRANGKPIFGIPERKVEQLASVHTSPTQPIPVNAKFSKQCATKSAYAGKKAPDGDPYKVGCIYTPYDDKQFVAFAPSALGGANWPPSAYSPKTGLHVHLLEGQRVGMAGSACEGSEAAGARGLLPDRGAHSGSGRHRPVDRAPRGDEHAERAYCLVGEMADDLL